MEDLTISLAAYIKQANAAMDRGEYDKAQNSVLRAAECALLLAKGSVGVKREKYMATYQSLKTMLTRIASKKAESRPVIRDDKPSYTPSAPSTPKTPSTPNVGGFPANKGETSERKPAQPKRNDALSPQYLDDYIGQPQAVTAVRDLIRAALLKNAAMPHLILYGSHGLGKTTFSKIIANEMRVGFTEVNVTKINMTEMIAILKKIQPKDILFIDEIHTLPLVVAESVLYSAMQDGKVTYTEGKGKSAHTETFELPPFTLIGATTEIGKLAKPFIQRAIQVRLEEYSDEVLGGIISKSFYKLGMRITPENGLYIAQRCRNNPRIANHTVKRISDKALVRYASINNLNSFGAFGSVDAIRKLNIEIERKVIDEFFVENGIDEYGLEKGDRELLKMIIHRYEGGPVGLDTLARAMNESNNVLSQKYEAYLIKKGMLRIDREGRVAMPQAYRVLGLPVPENLEENKEGNKDGNKDNNNNNSNNNKENEKQIKWEKKEQIAAHVQDLLKCEKIEQLIVYPDNVQTFEGDLNDLFPDVEQPAVEEEPRHKCELEIDFDTHKRTLSCDSFLESRFARAMAAVGYLKDIKAQTLELPYISQALANRRYYPDFVIRDYKNRLAVIEMKNFNMMSYHLNIDKYEQLKQYCESKGYGYAEIMKEYNADNYVSVEMIKNLPINTALEEYIIQTITRNGEEKGDACCTLKDLEGYGEVNKTEIYTILLNNRRLKNVDRVGEDVRIVFN